MEVLSPEDTIQRVLVKVADYRKMGVEHIWIFDPSNRIGFVCTPNGLNQPERGIFVVPGTNIYVSIAEIFAGLDEG
jgi:Uma2 family endonuclease